MTRHKIIVCLSRDLFQDTRCAHTFHVMEAPNGPHINSIIIRTIVYSQFKKNGWWCREQSISMHNLVCLWLDGRQDWFDGATQQHPVSRAKARASSHKSNHSWLSSPKTSSTNALPTVDPLGQRFEMVCSSLLLKMNQWLHSCRSRSNRLNSMITYVHEGYISRYSFLGGCT